MRNRVLVIGGGIVGLATALRLCRAPRPPEVLLLEKEAGVGRHQSTHNSGVLHAGLYYKPGSLKARLAVSGIRQMVAFCQENDIPHEICGKLVVATLPEELPRLRTLLERGQANGLRDLRWLEGESAIREIEPHATGLAAVHVPEEGIVDYAAVCAAMVRRIQEAGGTVRTGIEVAGAAIHHGQWRVRTTDRGEEFDADYLVNCGGLHSDRVAVRTGARPAAKIIPFRGEYYRLIPEREYLVRHLIYPVPDPRFPFLGVHFTRLIHGGVEAGPNAVLALKREGYTKTSFRLADAWESATFPGLWRFVAGHLRMSAHELAGSISKPRFCRGLQRFVPELRVKDLVPGGVGVRAQAMTREGELVQDFDLLETDHALHVLNAPSPAATASLAIGEEIATKVLSRRGMG